MKFIADKSRLGLQDLGFKRFVKTKLGLGDWNDASGFKRHTSLLYGSFHPAPFFVTCEVRIETFAPRYV